MYNNNKYSYSLDIFLFVAGSYTGYNRKMFFSEINFKCTIIINRRFNAIVSQLKISLF